MTPTNLLTDTELERRLNAARDAEKRARARIAKLKRVSATMNRRAETQRLCTLGRAIMAWSAVDERVMASLRRWLAHYITRDADRDILLGTPWEVPTPAGTEVDHVGS
jgi:hypothetical protein